MLFTLTGSVASKKNSKKWIKRGRRKYLVPGDVHAAWYRFACVELRQHRLPKYSVESAAVKITIFAKDRKKADLTNKADSIMDLLVDLGILEDDNWFICGDIHLIFGGVDTKNPRALIEITPLS